MSFRDHAPYHERRLEQQMLDTLLRIEEMLSRALVDLGTGKFVAPEDLPDLKPPPALLTKGKRK
jgi:hypothetical protein